MVEIIGAGMAGLLAANMLHRLKPTVYEAQNDLPNNHNAVLRFRSSSVGDTLGIPFKKVNMLKCSHKWRNPVADALAYSFKCTGGWRSDRSLPIEPVSQERFIAPEDFIKRMASGIDIRFNHSITSQYLKSGTEEPTISTMPMPTLMALLDYDCGDMFNESYLKGYVITAKVHRSDAYVSVYIPDPSWPFSRISITGDQFIAEMPTAKKPAEDFIKFIAQDAAELVGLPSGVLSNIELKPQPYFKILKVDDDERKRFIAWATDSYNIYSLGRFATWRPGLLLDDLVGDVRLIEKWIKEGNSSYQLKRHRAVS